MDGKLEKSLRSSSMPLISRLDHLDSMMYGLEGKKYSSARWGCEGSAPVFGVWTRSESVPLDFAVKEAQSKGSILDRITSLEERLIQVIQEIEQNSIRKTELEVSGELASQEKKISRKTTNKFEKGSPKHKKMFPTRLFHLRSLLGC
ncbi:uncharacterized protein LOC130801428 [Amaranthus tricolor]|uniref:uncharacterized protein LOC130801428 n=1 Tax=Amaranthus tricolor TaxID=29722 RepID=UPI00258BAB79|nr:uncharacterized protein LOC130801428 [Amaranthus tricolor]